MGKTLYFEPNYEIVLEDVKEKFDLVIGRIDMMNEGMNRHEQAEEERFVRFWQIY